MCIHIKTILIDWKNVIRTVYVACVVVGPDVLQGR